MGRVFDCAKYCNVKRYYQGTGSIHLNYGDVDKIVENYKDKYGQELVGHGLGQFHKDFSTDGAISEIYGNATYSLGKKTCLDMLEPTSKDTNIINDGHIRMRGIPKACVKYYAEQNM